MNTSDQIESLHALFIKLTGRDLPLDACGYRYSQWMDWIRYGEGTEEKLRVVVAHIKKGIRERKRHDGALKFHNLIVDWPRFADDYAQAMQARRATDAEKRCKLEPGKTRVMKATGRNTRVERVTRTAGEIAADLLKARDGWEKLRASI